MEPSQKRGGGDPGRKECLGLAAGLRRVSGFPPGRPRLRQRVRAGHSPGGGVTRPARRLELRIGLISRGLDSWPNRGVSFPFRPWRTALDVCVKTVALCRCRRYDQHSVGQRAKPERCGLYDAFLMATTGRFWCVYAVALRDGAGGGFAPSTAVRRRRRWSGTAMRAVLQHLADDGHLSIPRSYAVALARDCFART